MIRTLVVEDDADCRGYLRDLLRSHPDVRVEEEADNIADAGRIISNTDIDLLFLDVEMPGGSGFDLLKQLGTWPFSVIFTTGFQRYAIQAIRFSALDYLLKPVQSDELANALQRFRERHPQQDRTAMQEQFLANIGQQDARAMKLTLTVGDRTYFVTPTDVTHCMADDNYTQLELGDGRHFISTRTLKDYEDMLAPLGFLRVHRSALVNCAAVSHLDQDHLVLKGGTRIEVSRRKREEVMRVLAR